MRFIAAIILFFVCSLPVVKAEQKAAGPSKLIATKSTSAAGQPAQTERPPATRPDDQQALREDLKKMRVILHQMETNLAFVDSSPSALKHQFQLEIDMWRTLIDQMERRLPPNSR